jgi:hypothetical protein
VAGLIDQLDFANTDLLIDARAVLSGGLRGSHWATNGSALLMLLQRACGGRPSKDQDKPAISQRQIGLISLPRARRPPAGSARQPSRSSSEP